MHDSPTTPATTPATKALRSDSAKRRRPTLTHYTGALTASVLAAAALLVALPLQAQAAPTLHEHATTTQDGAGQTSLNADGLVTFVVTKGQKG